MSEIRRYAALVVGFAMIALAIPGWASAAGHPQPRGASRHVLLLSIDGMHESNLVWWVHHHPRSNLAHLVRGGTSYAHASTPVPSDSFPGLIAQVTGGDPRLGDARWRVLLARHNAIVRRAFKRYHGKEIDNAGDGFFATFSDQVDAIRCACVISDNVRELSMEACGWPVQRRTRSSGSIR